MTSLERVLKDAMTDRGRQVSADRLLMPDLRQPAPSQNGRGRWQVGAIGIAAVIVCLIAALALAIHPSSSAHRVTSTGRTVGLADGQWRVRSVTASGKTYEMTAEDQNFLAFGKDRSFTGSDSINTLNGRYVLHGNVLRINTTSIGAVGYAGKDPARIALMNGIEELVSETGSRFEISADNVLILQTADYTLNCEQS